MRGKKTSPEDIFDVLTSYAVTQNLSETARLTGIPFGTVKNIVDRNRDTDEFKILQDQKQEEFSEKASVIIDKLLDRITNEVENDEKEIPLHHLTTAIGTLYDKRALSRGEMTQNVGFATNLSIDKLAEISGFAKKDDTK
jgi:hypothetical protein